MTVTGPKVRDYTGGERTLPLEIDAGAAYELVLAMFVLSCTDECHEYEVDQAWLASIRQAAPAALADQLVALESCGGVWMSLIGMVHDAPAPRTIERFLDHLAAADPVAFRDDLLSSAGAGECGVAPAVVGRAAAGDAEALEEVLAADLRGAGALRHLLQRSPDETLQIVVDLLLELAPVLIDDADRTAAILTRDAAEKRALAGTMPPERLVEVATNGITFALEPEVSGVLLVPSVILRPWVVITQHGGLRIFCYPVTDEHLSADPDAPPAWIVEFFKALGDDKRLRILNLLASGDAGLAELTDQLALSKSTVHHHLRLLRAAGLVRVTVGKEKSYSFRTDAVPQASLLLEAYLTPRTTDS